MVRFPFGRSAQPVGPAVTSAAQRSSNAQLLLNIRIEAQASPQRLSRHDRNTDLRSTSINVDEISRLIQGHLEPAQHIHGNLDISFDIASDELTAKFSVLDTSRRAFLCIPRPRLLNATASMSLSGMFGHQPASAAVDTLDSFETETLNQALRFLSDRRAALSTTEERDSLCYLSDDSSSDGDADTLDALDGSSFGEASSNIDQLLDHLFEPALEPVDFASQFSQHSVQTRIGQELHDIAAALQRDPQTKLKVHYQNQPGIDQGGLQRQALSNAFQQLMNQEHGFITSDGVLSVAPGYLTQNGMPQELQNLGLVLGAIARHDLAVGHSLSQELYDQLVPVIRYSMQHSQLNLKAPEQLFGALIGDTPRKQDILEVLAELQPHLMEGVSGEYLKSDTCDQSEAMGYLADLEPLLILASGIVATMPMSWREQDISSLMLSDAIHGQADLRQELSQVRVEPRQAMSLT